MKVYVVLLEWSADGEHDFSYQIYSTKEKAIEELERMKQEEYENSWIGGIDDIEELENFEDSEDYFDCCYYDCRTTIWIEETEVK